MRLTKLASVPVAVAMLTVVGVAGAATVTRVHEVVVATTGNGAVNINTADVKELMTLEGVGRKVAERIVEYRTAHGPFKKPDEIRKVEGIGSGLWEKNRDRIVVK